MEHLEIIIVFRVFLFYLISLQSIIVTLTRTFPSLFLNRYIFLRIVPYLKVLVISIVPADNEIVTYFVTVNL